MGACGLFGHAWPPSRVPNPAAAAELAAIGGRRCASDGVPLVLETVNANSWPGALARVWATKAAVMFVQETGLTREAEVEAQGQLAAAGWVGLFAPAVVTDDGGLSGGVAVLVRSGAVGIREVSTEPHAGIFRDIRWGTEHVLTETRDRLGELDLTWGEVPAHADIDRPEDLARVPRHLLPDSA